MHHLNDSLNKMYKIVSEDFFGIEQLKLVNELTEEYLSLIPSFGGNIHELALAKEGQLHSIIAGDEQLASLYGEKVNYYRGAKLSPFPNRIQNGHYVFAHTSYQFEKNNYPHALHGFLWRQPFEEKARIISTDSASILLTHEYKSAHKAYPFNYEMELEFKLSPASFACTTRIVNTSEVPIPIGDGWHPYFKTGSQIDLLKLRLPANRRMEMDKTLIPTGTYYSSAFFPESGRIAQQVLDDCFELSGDEDIAETELCDEDKDITIKIWQRMQDKGYRYIQVFIPPDRKSIAIEPMTCAPNAFNTQKGLIILAPKEKVKFSFGVKLH